MIQVRNDYSSSRKPIAAEKVIAEVVFFHNEILKIWELFSKATSEILFFEFSLSAFILCANLFGIVLVSTIVSSGSPRIVHFVRF